MTLFRVLGCVCEFIANSTSVLRCTSCCVPIVCNHLSAHVCPSLLSLFLHVLQILGTCSGPHTCHTCCRSLSWDTLLSRQRSFPLLLHLLLAKLLSVTLLLQNPIKLTIVCITATFHEASIETSQIVIIRTLLKIQIAAVLQILAKFFWTVSGQLFDSSLNFLLLDAIVFVILVFAC